MTTIALTTIGIAAMVVGALVAVRLRRWSPHSNADLSDYDPGPDAVDWMQAWGLVGAGVALLLIALV